MALCQVQRSATVAFSPNAPYVALGTMAGAIDLSFSSSACLEIFRLDLSSQTSASSTSKPSTRSPPTAAPAAPEPEISPDDFFGGLGSPNNQPGGLNLAKSQSSDSVKLGELPLLGSSPAGDRFYRLSWGLCGADQASLGLPLGIIAGGMVDGTVALWNPHKLVNGESDGSFITKMTKHKGAVRGLEFNAGAPNLLASGAEDGELCIWDLAAPSSPSLYPALKSAGGAPQGEIACVAWNPKVQHILASTSFNGISVVWDLRKQKQVISFADPVGRYRCSSLAWNPDVATQLVVASDDDRSPALQVWDLRNAMSPVKELRFHSKGVLAMAWCPCDSGLLLTSAKDNRTVCWDTAAGEVLCELPPGSNWNFDVQWSARVPGLLSASSFDGKVSFFNIESASRTSIASSDFNAALSNQTPLATSRAPKWLKPPCGVSFGFGNQLASFGAASTQVALQRVVTEAALVARADALEAVVAQGDREGLKAYCQAQAAAAGSFEERETWDFLTVLFEANARQCLLDCLNFAPAAAVLKPRLPQLPTAQPEAAAGQPEGQDRQATSLDGQFAQMAVGSQEVAAAVASPAVGDVDFFDHYADGSKAEGAEGEGAAGVSREGTAGAEPAVNGDAKEGQGAAEEEEEEEEEEENLSGDRSWEDGVQRALVVGNYEAAVEACLAAGRVADALLLAAVGGFGSDLWQRTQQWYLKRSRRPFVQLIGAVVAGNMRELVAQRPLAGWRETLAILCTYASGDEWSSLCDELAAMLEAAGQWQAATLCYMCAGSIDRVADIWAAKLQPGGAGQALPLPELQTLLEKSVILGIATGQQRVGGQWAASFVSEYATFLSSQGRLAAARTLLSLLPGSDTVSDVTAEGVSAGDAAAAVLRDRIYRSGQVYADASQPAPAFPFPLTPLSAVPTPAPKPYSSHSAQASGGYGAYRGGVAAQQPYSQPYQPAAPAAPPSYAPQPAAPPPSTFIPQAQPSPSRHAMAPSHHHVPSHNLPPPSMPTSHPHSMSSGHVAPMVPSQPPPMVPAQPTPAPNPPPPGPQMFVPSAPPPLAHLQATGSAGSSSPRFTPSAAPPIPPTTFMPVAPPPGPPPSAPSVMLPSQPPPQLQSAPAPPPVSFTPVAPPPPAHQPPPSAPPPAAAPAAARRGPLGPPPGVFPPGYAPGPTHPPPGYAGGAPPAASASASGAAAAGGAGGAAVSQHQHQAAAPAPAVEAPAPTMQTADTSKVAAELRPVVTTLLRVFKEIAAAVEGPSGNAARRRELEANSRKLGALLMRLNSADVSASVAAKLLQLCAALDAGDFASALRAQVELTTKDWEEGSAWLTALKSLIKTRQLLR